MKTEKKWRAFALVAMLLFACSQAALADSTLSLGRPVTLTPLVSTNYRTSPLALLNVSLEAISVTSIGGPSSIKKVKVRIPEHSMRPTRLLIGLQSVSGVIEISRMAPAADGTAEFVIGGGYGDIADQASRSLVIKGEFDPTSLGGNPYGDFCRVQIVSIQYVTALGNQAVLTPTTPFLGPEHRFAAVAANWTLNGTPTITKTVSSSETSMEAKFRLRVAVTGGDILKPTAKDFVVIASVGRDCILCDTSAVTVVPNATRISSGSTANVTVTAQLPMDDPSSVLFQREGIVTFKVIQINWVVEGANAFQVEQTWGLEQVKTLYVETLTASIHPPVLPRLPPVSAKLWEEIATVSAPDETGFSGQVVSEGGVLHITPTRPNRLHRVVFPQASASGAQMMQVDVEMTSDDMVPHIMVPTDIGTDSRDPMIVHIIESVSKESDGNKTIAVRFEVLLGGQRMYGVARRTGERSCVASLYWGEDAGYGIPGRNIDLLDLSNSLTPVAPAVGTAYPQRFKLGNFAYMRKDAQGFHMLADLLPYATVVEASCDLATWQAVIPSLAQLQPSEIDAGYSAYVRVDRGALPLPLQNADTVYFRLKLRN